MLQLPKSDGGLYDYSVPFYKGIGFSDGEGGRSVVAFGRAQGEDEDLVFPVVDEWRQVGDHLGAFFAGKLALKDGILQMFAVAAHFFEDAPEAGVVANVVCDEIDVAHGSPRKEVWQAGNLAGQAACKKPGLDFENTPV